MHRTRRAEAGIVDNQVDFGKRSVGYARGDFGHFFVAQQVGDKHLYVLILLGKCLQAFAPTSNKHHRYARTPKNVHHFFTDSTRRTSNQCAFEREVANALPRVFRSRHRKPRGAHEHDAAPIRQLHHVRHALPLRRVA